MKIVYFFFVQNSSVDPVYMEALNKILEAWLLIIQEQKVKFIFFIYFINNLY